MNVYKPALLPGDVLKAFETVPDLYLILSPDLVILTASNAYLQAVGSHREALIGQPVYAFFSKGPAASNSQVLASLQASLGQVLSGRKPHRLTVPVYHMPQEAGQETRRCCQVSNTPVLGQDGAMQYIIHKVEDISQVLEQEQRLKKLEQEACERQQAYQLVNTFDVAFVELDSAQRFLFVNHTTEKYLGKQKEELLGKNIWELFPQAVGSVGYHAIRKALFQREKTETEYFSSVFSRYVFMSAVPSEKGVIILFYDRQDIQEAQQKISEQHRRLKAAEAIAHIGNFDWDAQTDAYYWSDEMYRMHGLEPQSEVITAEKILQFIHPQEKQEFLAGFLGSKDDPFVGSLVHRIIRPDGAIRYMNSHYQSFADARGKVSHVSGTTQDITESLQTEAGLRKSEENSRHLLNLLQNAPDAYLILGADLTIQMASEAYLQATLTKRELIIGKNIFEVFPENPDTPEAHALKNLRASFQRVLRTKEPHRMAILHYDVPRPASLGGGFEEKYWSTTNTPVLNNKGEVAHILHRTVDVTDLVKKQSRIKNLARQTEMFASALKDLKLQSAQLEEGRALLQAVFDASPNSIALYKIIYEDTGAVADFEALMINAYTYKITGLSPEEIIGKRFSQVFPQVLTNGIFDQFKKMASGGEAASLEQAGFEQWYEGEGQQRCYHFRFTRLDGLLVVTTADVTERKKAEQEMLRMKDELAQRAEDKYFTLFNSLNEGFFVGQVVWNEGQQPVDFCFTDSNPAFEKHTGLKPAAGITARELMPDTAPFWFELAGQVARSGQASHFIQAIPALEKTFEINAFRIGNAAECQVAVLFNDITEGQRAQEALRESEERKAFLLKLSDALRPLKDPVEIQSTASKILGETLQVSRVHYGEVSADDQLLKIVCHYTNGVPTLSDVFRIADIDPQIMRRLRAGQKISMPDLSLESSLSQSEKLVNARLGIKALVGVPLIKGGRFTAILAVQHARPRAWTAHEIGMIEETAQRTWDSVQRALAEAALRKSEEQFRLFVTASSDVVYKMSSDWRLMYHLSGKNFIAGTSDPGSSWLEKYIPPEDQAQVLTHIREAIQTKSIFSLEHRIYQADGTRGWTFSRAIPVLDARGEILEWLGAAQDVTARKRAEEALQLAQESLTIALAAGQMGTWHLDLVADKSSKRNLQHDRLFGYSKPQPAWGEQIAKRHVLPQDHEIFDQAFARAFETGDLSFDVRVQWPDASIHWMACRGRFFFDEQGKPLRAAGVNFDISERKKTEQQLLDFNALLERQVLERTQALKESKDLLQSIFDVSLTGFAVLKAVRDTQNNIIDFEWLFSNNTINKERGQDNLVGKRFAEVYPGLNATGVFERYVRTVEEAVPQDFELHLTYEGADHWHRVITVKLNDGLVLSSANITERKKAAVTIEQMLNGSISAICILDAQRDQQGHIVDFIFRGGNKAAEKINLMPMEAALGKGLLELLPRAKEVFFDTFVQVVETGEPLRVECYYPHQSSGYWLDVSAVRNGDGFIMTFHDITPQKTAEQELIESKELLQLVFDTSPNLITAFKPILNQHGQLEDFEFIFANACTCRATARPDLVGCLLNQTLPMSTAASLFKMLKQVVATGKPLDSELWYEGEELHHWFRIIAVPMKEMVLVTAENITQRKKAEEEIRKSISLLEQSEAVARMGSWEYDIASGVLHWSEGMYRLFGLPKGSPVSLQTYAAFAVAADKLVMEKVVQYMSRQPASFEETLRIQTGNSIQTLKTKGAVIKHGNGAPAKVLGIALDVSEIKRLEKENLQIRLEQQKALLLAILEAQEEERRRISESLHNGVGQMLYATKLNLDQVAHLVPKEAIQTTEKLIFDAINETRRISHELVPVVLKDFGLKEAISDLCRGYYRSSLHLYYEIEGLGDRLESHLEVALFRITQELVNNVVKHAGATQANILLVQEKDEIILKVRDNGWGINPTALRKGGGIGIRTISDRVKLLNGTFSIETLPAGEGALVSIRIPVKV